jgi:2-keto-4-pentenoate hydratase/2-oxohepta-3-ene-1,7-dioic acid hydratase in catechol pathway
LKFIRFIKSPSKTDQPEQAAQYGILEPIPGGEQIRPLQGNLLTEYALRPETFRMEDIVLLAPVLPPKIVAVGVNYRAHAEEFKKSPPKEPLLFLKPPTAVIGPGEAIQYPPQAGQVDLEAELAVVIKHKVKRVSPQEVKQAILGYTCFNDVTARDLQRQDGQWTRAKGFDTFAPMGPCIVTDLDPADLAIQSTLNGKIMQSARTSQMIFDVYTLVSFISRVMTLLPGDVVATGTPAGVGPMQRGDVVEIFVEGIGTLQNKVV